MTGSDRLDLLMPWLNAGDGEMLDAEVRARMKRFLHRFRTPTLRVVDDVLWSAHRAPDAELRATWRKLHLLLDVARPSLNPDDSRGMELVTDDDRWPILSGRSLRFEARPVKGGGFDQVVFAEHLRDLVPYLVLQLLTASGVALARCPAPRAHEPKLRCDRLFLARGVGRPRAFCSDTCRVRHHLTRRRKS